MPDRDAVTDPVDKAYAQAEALLGDEAARAARRARMLAAVAREPASPSLGAAAERRRSPWRRGDWLAAAGVVGICLFLTARVYQPVHLPMAATTPAAPAPVTRQRAAPPPPLAKGPAAAPAPAPSRPRPSHVHRVAPEPEAFPAAPPLPPPSPIAVPAIVSAPPLLTAPPASSVDQVVIVTGSRIGRRSFATSSPALPARLAFAPVVATAADPAARLHTAAALGRTAELETLLAQGVPVDAPDAYGATALMASIQAGQPAAAALLRRHGASLDQKDRAGVSARDMAAARHDPELDQALGLDDAR